MQTYTSRPFTIKKDNVTVFRLFKNPLSLEGFLEKTRDKLPTKDVVLTEDSVSFTAPMVGALKFVRIEEEEPNVVKYRGEGTPVPMTLCAYLTPTDESSTSAQVSVEADVPAFLSGMIKTQVNPLLEKAADALEQLDVDRLLGAND